MIKRKTARLCTAAFCLALSIVMPFLTNGMRSFGKALCPMHFGILICGFLCGWEYGLIAGAVAPLLRFLIFGMPPLFPTAAAMTFELACYGAVCGILYSAFPKRAGYIYLSLVISMLSGRIVWGAARVCLSYLGVAPFPFSVFLTEGFLTAIPGIIFQLLFVPAVVLAVKKIT